MSIRVFLVDDHALIREGVACLLAGEDDIVVVGTAADGRDAVEQVCRLRPDLVICDVAMPNLNGVDATRQITEFDPSIKVLALSQQSDPLPVSRMIRAGASGYVLKGADFRELLEGLRAVIAGESYLSPAAASGLVREYIERSTTADDPDRPLLTAREREVLQLVSEGYRTREIADSLGVSVKTIETHRKGMMVKLGVNSIAGLTKYAVRTGLTTLEP